MAWLTFNQQRFKLISGESVLDCLLRHGINYPFACREGICQTCLAKTATVDSVDIAWQTGLKPTLAVAGYFLACKAKPKHDFSCSAPKSTDVSSKASIDSVIPLNDNVFCLRLKTKDYAPWTPGKYLNLVNPSGVIRSYSIANLPHLDNYIELHIKTYPQGEMSRWLANTAKVGDVLDIRGPIGSCFYLNPTKKSFPIILIGTGTGLAPLVGILKDALYQHHSGNIHLIHGGLLRDDLYMDSDLTHLAKTVPTFSYTTSVLAEENSPSLDALLISVIKENIDATVYVCGPDDMTNQLKMTAFMAGISSSAIYADAFVSKN